MNLQYAQSFAPSALYVLSENGTPNQAIEEALAIAKDGGVITHKRAKRIIETANEQMPSEWDEEEIEPMRPKLKPTPLDRLKKWWAEATPTERREFLQWIEERVIKTDIDTKTGERKLVPARVAQKRRRQRRIDKTSAPTRQRGRVMQAAEYKMRVDIEESALAMLGSTYSGADEGLPRGIRERKQRVV